MTIKFQKNKGFVGVVFLAIALIAVVIGAISSISRSSSSGTNTESMRAGVSVMLKHASDFKIAFDRKIVDGTSPANITFDSTVNTGIFDPTPGAQYAVKHATPKSVAGTSFYTYNKLITLPGIGSSSADYLVITRVSSLAVCQMVNTMLYNDPLTAQPAISTGGYNNWMNTAVSDGAHTATNYVGRPEGCVAATSMGAGPYLYYKALVEN